MRGAGLLRRVGQGLAASGALVVVVSMGQQWGAASPIGLLALIGGLLVVERCPR